MSASPAPSRPQTVLVGCPPGEWHTFTPLLLSLLLRRRGLNVIYLGANVPSDRFAETAHKVKANLVILVAQTLVSAASLQHAALAITSQDGQVAFGGRIFAKRPGIMEYVPGFYLGDSLEPSIQEVEKILRGKSTEREIKTASQEYRVALHSFLSKRTHIESTLKERVQPLFISPEGLNTGIHFLGDNIAAALQLGDTEHLNDEVEWLKVLVQTHDRPPEAPWGRNRSGGG
ncbi:MAG TPA: hypothetical protein PLF42_10265, partial [Anaerolineales bacterium]|nr:hypothetical protein [Anaerolineales bacterium]